MLQPEKLMIPRRISPAADSDALATTRNSASHGRWLDLALDDERRVSCAASCYPAWARGSQRV